MPTRTTCPASGRQMRAPLGAVSVECPACGSFHRLTKKGTLRVHRVLAVAK